MPAPTCNFCSKVFTSWDNVARHKTNAPECRKKVDKNLDSTLERLRKERCAKDIAKAAHRNGRRRPQVESPPPSPSEDPDPDPHVDEAAAPFEPQENYTSEPDAVPPGTTPPAPESAAGTGFGRKYWRRDCPGHGGARYGTGKTKFEEIRDDEILKGAEVWGPFKDESEWELAKWLIKNVGHTAADEFLKLSIITERAKPSIGNIGKETRRQVSANATVLIGYLPIPKFDCFDKNMRSLAKYRLFHQCMTVLLASVAEAERTGAMMVCADNFVRNVWPIFAAYVADYPEQCLVACCKENRCPLCTVDPNDRDDHLPHEKRDQVETLFFMARQQHGEKDTVFETEGMRAVYPPFWMNLPHSDIFQAFTRDLLHQLHKGVFKDHLVKWCTEIIGKLEIDKRFREMPDHPGLRHFKNGISSVSQWTGTEHKEMEKVFLGLVAAGAHPELIKAVRAVMDFARLASLQSHTSLTLLALRAALDDFHAHKKIFIELGGRKEHFNIPKIHSLEHYEASIRLFGSADGFNTESPEPSAENDDDDDTLIHHTYSIAKHPPAATRRVVGSHIIANDGHNAIRFLPALTQFLRSAQGSTYTPYEFDIFPTWKRLKFTLPDIPEVGDRHSANLVRATAPVVPPGGSRYKEIEPAYHDVALVKTAEANSFTDRTALHGLRIAQVRAIFQLPGHYPVKSRQPLAYVEWFTPLRAPTNLNGYHHVSRSTRRIAGKDGPYAEIITVDRIVRNAMLIPHKWGEDSKFRVNSHIDGHLFCMFKLNYKDCLPV
ncbi:hypothetical protein B0H17DRAFT_1136229 [Mycena rosella]|uniref:C2H2-type domain-containing protein n=1 Tax=Mycena rosella TaxID=1033263 RepID=A0AAD7DBQ9_MYCRO|nr:hypothetical protein B0H17DRAFT_1136229 [Mycena rosella]